MDSGVFDEGACGVEGCESVSESSSQAMFSSGERAAPGGGRISDKSLWTKDRLMHTFQHVSSPLLLRLDDHQEKIVSCPEISILYLLRHYLLH